MSSSMLQLSAYGPQDLYLTGNPQITFFKVVYRRHTNFSMETIKLGHSGDANNFGQESYFDVPKGGADLIYKMYLTTKLPSISINSTDQTKYIGFRWLNWPGHTLIKECDISIGGQLVDQITGEWIHIWNELSQKSEKQEGYAEMVGNVPGLTQIQTFNYSGTPNLSTEITPEYPLNIPIPFWFTKNPGLALPIIALNNTDIRIRVELKKLDEMIWCSEENANNIRTNVGQSVLTNNTANSTIKLVDTEIYAEHIFLDGPERKRFAQTPHEYLIEVLKRPVTGETITSASSGKFTKQITSLQHPTKEIIWTLQPSWFTQQQYTQSRGGAQWYNYTTEWNYSGFNGSGSSNLGPGLVGGRNPDFFYGKSIQRLPYILGKFTPDFENGFFSNYNSQATSKGNEASPDLQNAGYDYISQYHITNNNSNLNNYTTKFTNNLLGEGAGRTVVGTRNANDQALLSTNNTQDSYAIWSQAGNRLIAYSKGKNPVKNASIIISGITKVNQRDSSYFNLVQPYQHHTCIPAPGINVYSFALDPEEHQPSGSCNFAKLNSFDLEIELVSTLNSSTYLPVLPISKNTNTTNTSYTFKVYAVCYNILRIMSGIGALAYST